jgi:hypothetical protein
MFIVVVVVVVVVVVASTVPYLFERGPQERRRHGVWLTN